tara:strand:- start:93 stop:341 length:249 start_codon:yes stop_codon:yes gene_type:complete
MSRKSDEQIIDEMIDIEDGTGPGGEHYKDLSTLEFIESQGWLGFHKGCIAKYLARYQDKGGIKDLKKARFYINRLIELEGKE